MPAHHRGDPRSVKGKGISAQERSLQRKNHLPVGKWKRPPENRRPSVPQTSTYPRAGPKAHDAFKLRRIGPQVKWMDRFFFTVSIGNYPARHFYPWESHARASTDKLGFANFEVPADCVP